MSDAEFLNTWLIGVGIALVVVVVVAALLLAVTATARRTLSLAVTALRVAEQIEHATRPVWQLQTTNAVMAEMAAAARQIEGHTTAIADSLKGK
jgi:hypothetical protein